VFSLLEFYVLLIAF